MDGSWRARPANSEDGQAILELFNEVFHKERAISHWRWKFIDNPTNKIHIFVAEDSSRIVGQFAILPTFMNLSGLKILGAQSLDTMTHPAYRRQGISVSLAKECFTKAGSEGTKLVYGFPNEQSYPIDVKRLDWPYLGRLPQLVKILNPKAIIERKTNSTAIATITEKPVSLLLRLWKGGRRPEPSEHVKIAGIDTFDNRFDALWAKTKDKLPLSVWKDSRYLNWRYLSCPDSKYTILAAEEDNILVGFIVLKCGVGRLRIGYIIDFLCLPERATAAALLIHAGLNYLKNQGMDIAICHMFEHSPFYRLFTNQGFFKYGRGVRFMVRLTANRAASYSIIFDRKKWHLMEGDIDTF